MMAASQLTQGGGNDFDKSGNEQTFYFKEFTASAIA